MVLQTPMLDIMLPMFLYHHDCPFWWHLLTHSKLYEILGRATFEVPFHHVTAFIPKLGEMLTDPDREKTTAAINGDLPSGNLT